MTHKNLKRHMMLFPLEKLKDFLGRDLVDSMLEWSHGKEAIFTKSHISDMILCINGISIMKDKTFRIQLLRSFSEDNILLLRQVLAKQYHSTQDLEAIINEISKKKWGSNNISKKILEVLEYEPEEIVDILKENSNEQVSSEVIESYDRFYELLDYQFVIRQKALNVLNSPNPLSKLLIHMPTGTGKTKTAMHIICHHYKYSLHKEGLVVWIAHTTELLNQAYDTFSSVWKNIGNGKVKVYKFWGNHELNLTEENISGVIICGIQKLQSICKTDKLLFEKLIQNARLIIYDEAHKAAAEDTRNIINSFMIKKDDMPDRSLLGLSATPGRSTEESFDNNLLVSMFDNKIIKIDTNLLNDLNLSRQEAINTEPIHDIIQYFQETEVLAKIEKEELTYNTQMTTEALNNIKVVATSNGYNDFSKNALETIGKNKNRNFKILQRLQELNDEKIPTIVFACSLNHAKLLSAMLTLRSVPNALVFGEMSQKERDQSIKKFKDINDKTNILINYEVLTTGFDATNIECVFITRPTQSVVLYSQMIGRGLRGPKMGGKPKCLLIDIKDNLLQYDENMAFSHFNNYWEYRR